MSGCIGFQEVGTELVECDESPEWLVDGSPSCSGCVVTFFNLKGPTTVVPIEPFE